jgi:hypothetical protein
VSTAAIRNWQGQLATIQGAMGSYTGTTPGVWGVDGYSRIGLPPATAIVRVELNVIYKTAAGSQAIEWSGTTSSINVTATGRYDITALVLGSVAGANPRYGYARLIPLAANDVIYFVEVVYTV